MASRNVALRMEAYRALEWERREGESFSDAVLRLVRGRPRLSEIIATFEPISERGSREFERHLKEDRRDAERSIRRRHA